MNDDLAERINTRIACYMRAVVDDLRTLQALRQAPSHKVIATARELGAAYRDIAEPPLIE